MRFKYNLLVSVKKIKEINKLRMHVLVKKLLEDLKPKWSASKINLECLILDWGTYKENKYFGLYKVNSVRDRTRAILAVQLSALCLCCEHPFG